MTYEEALAKVLEVAGDYTNTRSTHDIGMALYTQETTQLRNELDDAVKSLSLSPESIQLSVDKGELVIEAFGKKTKTWSSIYGTSFLRNATTEFPQFVDRAFRSFIKDSALQMNLPVKDIQRFCGYTILVMNSITKEFTDNITRIGIRLKEIDEESAREKANYTNYCAALEGAMRKAANYWMATTTIKPGMRLSIVDLRSDAKGSEVRRVKRVRVSDGEVVIAFDNTSSIVRGKSRINVFESWLLNNAKFLEIAKVLKRAELQKLF